MLVKIVYLQDSAKYLSIISYIKIFDVTIDSVYIDEKFFQSVDLLFIRRFVNQLWSLCHD